MLNLSKAVTVRDLLVYGIVMATLRAYEPVFMPQLIELISY